MSRRRYSFLAIAALAGAAVSLLLTGSARSQTTGSAPLVKSLPTYFRDSSGNPVLGIQIQPGHIDTGQFAFYVAGNGEYVGRTTIATESAHVERLSGTVPVQLYPEADTAPTPTSLRMEGIIDPTDLTANVNVWVDGAHYHLQTDEGRPEDAAATAKTVLSALQSEDWTALYPMLMSDTQKQQTEAAFVQQMTAQAAQGPKILSLSPSGDGKVITSRYGYTYYQQPITVNAQEADGTTKTISSTLYLVRENETWRFWGTDKVPSS